MIERVQLKVAGRLVMVHNFCPMRETKEFGKIHYDCTCIFLFEKGTTFQNLLDKNLATQLGMRRLVGDLHLRDYDNYLQGSCPTDSGGKEPTIATKPDNRVKDDQRFVRIQHDWCQELWDSKTLLHIGYFFLRRL